MRTRIGPFLKAFTVVEILLAIAIFSMVLVAIYASWTAIIRGSNASLDAAARVQRSRMAMRALEDALLTTVMYQQNFQHYEFVADTSGDFAYLSLVSSVPPSFPGGGMYGELRTRRVSFSVEPNSNNQPELVMRQIPFLWETNSEVEPYSLVLARDVREFLLEFWDSQRNEWVSEWTISNQLPAMVRVAVAIGGKTTASDAPPELTVRTVALPGLSVLPEWQSPPPGTAPGTPQPPPDGGPGQNPTGSGANTGRNVLIDPRTGARRP